MTAKCRWEKTINNTSVWA